MNWLREPDSEPIPGYTLVAPLGTGGFGEVWKCLAPGGIYKAIKFVYGNLNSLDGDSAKAEQEFKALERVKAVRHPFVLMNERIDVVGGELIIVMELADKSLYDLMVECQKAGRPGIPRDMLLGFLSDAAEGLDHLIEKHNLQHLDVKPKNLFLIADRVKVADFGLVKHLERQSMSGIMGGITPVYAAPETFANKISKHSDQYSLAVLYCELLTGHRPFSGKNIRQLALQHMTEAPDLSMLPPGDRDAVARALAKSPEDRFPSCLAFLRALGAGSQRADVTPSPSGDTPVPANKRGATVPDVHIGATQAVPNRVKRTPPPVTAANLARFPDTPAGTKTMSMSVSFGLEEGVLRPAILIGIGSFGRRALQQIRCRLLDRIGELGQVPCFRFVYLDADPETVNKASSGPADAALLPEHTFHAPLQPVTAYRRRQLDHLLEWLPREKLYSIPRSLRVDGSRALGRLAFWDHYLRFMTRLKHEIQVATHPEALSQSTDQTGLQVKTKVPSVYVFASASGGTSGMLLDVGHAARRVLERFNIPEAPMTAFVFAGAPEDTASPPAELANIFATLTELNHYADEDVTFVSQYGGPEGPQVESRGLPFTATYLLPMAQRSAEAFRDCVSHLAGYVAHDLTTPLGTGLEKLRRKPTPAGRTPFRGFGTFGVWYPRGLLLRSAARQLCSRLLRSWASPGEGPLPSEAGRTLNMILTDPRLTPDEVKLYIASEAGHAIEGNPVEGIRAWAAGLASQVEPATRRPDPTSWAVGAWDQARDWIGLEPTTDTASPFRRGRLSRALDSGLQRAVGAWVNELTELLRPVGELSGSRLAATEAIVAELVAGCATTALALEKQFTAFVEPREKAKADVQAALEACNPDEGFSLFGNRVARNLRTVADRVRAFADLRVKEDLTVAAAQFYRRLQTIFEERLRDLSFARGRVSDLTQLLDSHVMLPGSGAGPAPNITDDPEEAMQTTLQGSNTIRVVLPYGEEHLDKSAAELLTHLPQKEQQRLELILTRLVIEPRGGLVSVCRSTGDLFQNLAAPMIEQATAFLTNLLPSEDVTAVEISTAGATPGELARRVVSYAKAAAPLADGPPEEERTFVLVPDSEAGQHYAKTVRDNVPGATTVPVRGHGTDLLFCREQGSLRTADLFRLLEPCWEAYHQAAANTETNPHARFDVTAWMPLVE